MKIHWLGTTIEDILLLLIVPSLIGLALLRILIDDVCTCGTHKGDGRRFKRIVE